MDKPRVKVGVGVLILNKNKILLGKRISGHNKGTWQSAGGHLEFGERFEECVIREVKEETGLMIKNIKQVVATNDIFPNDKKHYVTVFFVCKFKKGVPKPLEPDKCSEWRWFDKGNLPKNLFLPYDKIVSLLK